MSVAANKAKGRRSDDETMDLVRGLRAAAGSVQAVDGLTADQWERLNCRIGYSQPSGRCAETAVQPMVVFPAKYMMTGHALIYLQWLLSHVPWRSGRQGTAQRVCHAWSLNFPGKRLRRAAEKVAFQYCQAAVALSCKLRGAGVAGQAAAPWQWLAEDAWRNPAMPLRRHRSAAHLGLAVFVADAALDAASLTYIASRLQQADRQVPALGTT